jgi:energy-coupling factor transporter ATP-binding protein EcfA2
LAYSIEFNDVSFRYDGAEQDALKHISFRLQPGEIVLLTGPAGSGKTTLCSCVNGLVPHHHEGSLTGTVLVGKYDTRRARIGGLASIVGLVFQDPESQIVTASVADEVAFGPENLGVPRQQIIERVTDALAATRLAGYEDRDPISISGGEQQATVIASIYAMQPEIYVMDEPLANLDPVGRSLVLKLIVDVAKARGKTLLLVEHALEEVLPLVDRVMIIHQGELLRDGPTREVLAAGDIPGVFTRPAMVRLAERAGIDTLPLTPTALYEQLNSSRRLGRITNPIPAPAARQPGLPVIEMRDVHFAYGGLHTALKGIDLEIGEGEMVAILGRNGSGKTTLVRHMIGLLQPDRGSVIVLGQDVRTTPTHDLARQIGFCFQNPSHQLVTFNVRDEITFGLQAHSVNPAEFESRTKDALDFVGLQDHLDTEIFDLGKGQRQRLALASVLALHPRILIIDEPTTGQDPLMALEIFDILRRLNEVEGATVLLITHKIGLAASYAQRALVLRSGRLDFDGSFQDLLTDEELMAANSLELPPVTRLARLLEPHGVPPWLSDYDRLAQALEQLTGGSNDD